MLTPTGTAILIFSRAVRGLNGTFALIASLTGTTCNETSLTNGQAYWYKVSAVNSVGAGENSSKVSAAPQSQSADNNALYAGIEIAAVAVIAIAIVLMRKK